MDIETLAAANAMAIKEIYGAGNDATLRQQLKAGTETYAELHLGFYLDENGDLVQVDN